MTSSSASPRETLRSAAVRRALVMTVGVFALLGGVILLILGGSVLTQGDGDRIDLGTGTTGGDVAAISSVPLAWDTESYLGAPLETVDFTATSQDSSAALFIGMAEAEDVDRLLDGEATTVDDGHRFEHTEHAPAGAPSDPRELDIWSAQATGDGEASLQFAPAEVPGEQVLVIMTVDGEPLGTVDVASGGEAPVARTVSIVLVAGGAALTIGGLVLTTITVRRAAAARRQARS